MSVHLVIIGTENRLVCGPYLLITQSFHDSELLFRYNFDCIHLCFAFRVRYLKYTRQSGLVVARHCVACP